jgi:hypothetical protein
MTEAQGILVQVPFRMGHRSIYRRVYTDKPASASFVIELDNSLNLGKQGMIVPKPHVFSWFKLGSPLPNKD